MMRNDWRAVFAALALSALAFSATSFSPAFAHNGEQHETTTTTTATTSTAAPGESAPPMDASQMAWPSDEDSMPGMHHEERPKTFIGRLLRWLGAWHPAAVHFPVALLLTVAFLELAAAVRRKPIYNAGNKLLLALAALSAFVTAPLGWLTAGLPAANDDLALTVHRWLGTAMPFLFLALWAFKRPAEEAAVRKTPPYFELLLAVTVIAITVQAYFGAMITHGAEHLAF